ncbi:hypothetical protein ACLQ25_09475 [Micromonospora sp. DT44]|uniref:hypothetical protein n=1 Tax=Micromonospora sp. DT44 TaxID=3393439 RepID=UPI003CE9D375
MSGILATATAAKSGSTVTAVVNGVETTVQVARDLTVAAGDVLLVERVGAQWFALVRLYSAAPTPPDDNVRPPDPKPAVVTGTLVVSPVETRSYRPSYGWRTDNTDVYQGQYGGWGNHTGAVFYGSKPRSLAGATVTDAKIRVKRLSAGAYSAQSTTMRLMTQATRPGGAPTLTSSGAGPTLAVGATTNAYDVPTSWAQAMVDGTAGGLAFFTSGGSPYVRFAGRGSWSPAFTLTITWRRG